MSVSGSDVSSLSSSGGSFPLYGSSGGLSPNVAGLDECGSSPLPPPPSGSDSTEELPTPTLQEIKRVVEHSFRAQLGSSKSAKDVQTRLHGFGTLTAEAAEFSLVGGASVAFQATANALPFGSLAESFAAAKSPLSGGSFSSNPPILLGSTVARFHFEHDPKVFGRICHVAAGVGHVVVLTDTGHVFTFGQGSSGQLGLGRAETRVTKALALVPLDKAVQRQQDDSSSSGDRQVDCGSGGDYPPVAYIAAGEQCTSALTFDGRLIQWGGGVFEPTVQRGPLSGKVVRQIAHGRRHCVALVLEHDVKQGKLVHTVWTWGDSNADGQLCRSSKSKSRSGESTPARIAFNLRPTSVFAVKNLSGCVSETGDVWAWGRPGADGVRVFTAPTKLAGLSDVLTVSCARNYVQALCSNGALKVWSAGSDESNDILLSGATVHEHATGFDHWIARSADSQVWTQGRGREGQVIVGGGRTLQTPTVVSTFSGADAHPWHVAAGPTSSFVLLGNAPMPVDHTPLPVAASPVDAAGHQYHRRELRPHERWCYNCLKFVWQSEAFACLLCEVVLHPACSALASFLPCSGGHVELAQLVHVHAPLLHQPSQDFDTAAASPLPVERSTSSSSLAGGLRRTHERYRRLAMAKRYSNDFVRKPPTFGWATLARTMGVAARLRTLISSPSLSPSKLSAAAATAPPPSSDLSPSPSSSSVVVVSPPPASSLTAPAAPAVVVASPTGQTQAVSTTSVLALHEQLLPPACKTLYGDLLDYIRQKTDAEAAKPADKQHGAFLDYLRGLPQLVDALQSDCLALLISRPESRSPCPTVVINYLDQLKTTSTSTTAASNDDDETARRNAKRDACKALDLQEFEPRASSAALLDSSEQIKQALSTPRKDTIRLGIVTALLRRLGELRLEFATALLDVLVNKQNEARQNDELGYDDDALGEIRTLIRTSLDKLVEHIGDNPTAVALTRSVFGELETSTLAIVRQKQNKMKQLQQRVVKKKAVPPEFLALGEDCQDIWIPPDDVAVTSKLLGVGSYASVFYGIYRRQKVAVKVMRDEVKPSDVADFNREIKLLRDLRSPRNVHIWGVTMKPHMGNPLALMCVLELCDSGSLTSFLKDVTRRFHWNEFFLFTENIVTGVNTLHAWVPPVVHRDLKTDNILVDSNGIKLADFGKAMYTAKETETSSWLQSNTILFELKKLEGTPIYLAPEMSRVGAKVASTVYGPKQDIYSLAFIIWELLMRCLTGVYHRPGAADDISGMQAVYKSEEQGWREKFPDRTPRQLKQLIERCWHPNPSCRPDCPEILEAIEQAESDYVARQRDWDALIAAPAAGPDSYHQRVEATVAVVAAPSPVLGSDSDVDSSDEFGDVGQPHFFADDEITTRPIVSAASPSTSSTNNVASPAPGHHHRHSDASSSSPSSASPSQLDGRPADIDDQFPSDDDSNVDSNDLLDSDVGSDLDGGVADVLDFVDVTPVVYHDPYTDVALFSASPPPVDKPAANDSRQAIPPLDCSSDVDDDARPAGTTACSSDVDDDVLPGCTLNIAESTACSSDVEDDVLPGCTLNTGESTTCSSDVDDDVLPGCTLNIAESTTCSSDVDDDVLPGCTLNIAESTACSSDVDDVSPGCTLNIAENTACSSDVDDDACTLNANTTTGCSSDVDDAPPACSSDIDDPPPDCEVATLRSEDVAVHEPDTAALPADSTPSSSAAEGTSAEYQAALQSIRLQFSYSSLQRPDVRSTLPAAALEAHLIDAQFETVFGMSRDKFFALPVWRQRMLKQKANLF